MSRLRAVSSITVRFCASLKANWAPLLLLFLLTGITYSEVLNHDFLINWDDQAYITKNRAIRGFSVDNLKAAFTNYYVGNYAPVQIVSYMLDHTLWRGNPFGYLLANILYHFCSGVLLYYVLLRQGIQKWGAALGAAVFLVHPVQVESVAWLSQRKNILAMLMYLASFHAYLSYRKSESGYKKWYIASIIFFLTALMAKSVAVIFPLMLVMYDLLIPPVRRRFRDHLDKLPYFATALAFGLLAMVTQLDNHGGGRVSFPDNALFVVPFSMLPVLVTYLRLLLWPAPSSMSVMYFPALRESVDVVVLAAFIVAVLLVGLGWFCYKKNRTILFWYGLFFLGLLPVSQIVPIVTMMNDRYLYFPMLGVAGLVAYGADKMRGRGGWLLILSVTLVTTLAALSYTRGLVWMDTITLFGDAAAKYPNEVSTLSGLAEGYVAAGDIRKAQNIYEAASTKGKLDDDAIYNLVQIYFEVKNFDAAYKYISAMKRGEDKYTRRTLLLGEYLYRTGNYPDAEENLLAYLGQVPDSVHGLYLLGQTYLMTGHNERAFELYSKALVFGGENPGLYFAIACVESLQGHPDSSFEALQAAFKKGFSAKDLADGEWCLGTIQRDPRYLPLVRQYLGK